MYTSIRNPRITIYNGATKELIGAANFKLTPEAEKALLQLVNYGKVPASLLILDIELFRPAKGYLPPRPFEAYKREGIINALFFESDTGEEIPIEIRIKYTARARSSKPDNLYFYNSVDFGDIEVDSVREIT